MTARTSGRRARVIEVRWRPSNAAVTVGAGVTARQMIGRLSAGGDRAADYMAAFALFWCILEYAFDVAGVALRLFMPPAQRKAGLIVIITRLTLGGGITRTGQRHAQQCEANEQQCRPTGKRITLSLLLNLFMHGRSPLDLLGSHPFSCGAHQRTISTSLKLVVL